MNKQISSILLEILNFQTTRSHTHTRTHFQSRFFTNRMLLIRRCLKSRYRQAHKPHPSCDCYAPPTRAIPCSNIHRSSNIMEISHRRCLEVGITGTGLIRDGCMREATIRGAAQFRMHTLSALRTRSMSVRGASDVSSSICRKLVSREFTV